MPVWWSEAGHASTCSNSICFCCVITPNNFVLTELTSQGHKAAIKNCIWNHYMKTNSIPNAVWVPWTGEQITGEMEYSDGKERPFGIYPPVCDLRVHIHYGCCVPLFRGTNAARYILKTYGDKQRRKHLIDPKWLLLLVSNIQEQSWSAWITNPQLVKTF